MKDILQDKGIVTDPTDYMVNMIMRSDMGKAFPHIAAILVQGDSREKLMEVTNRCRCPSLS
jgi:hypothetical protein